ncbi:MAG: DNA gyrase inhibitor YacG [Pseudomonadota bacterium]
MPTNCPLCDRPVVAEHKPFCSRGCRDRDLLKWLDEGYRLPGGRADHDAPGSGLDNQSDPD